MFNAILFQVGYYFHYIFNNLISIFVNLLIDVLMVIHVRQDLRAKKERIDHSRESNSKKEICNSNNNENSEKGVKKRVRKKLTAAERKTKAEIIKAERDTIKLVFSSSLVYVICRIPETVVYLHMPIWSYYKNQNIVMYNKKCDEFFCYILVDVVHYIYTFSYLTTILFYFTHSTKHFAKALISF